MANPPLRLGVNIDHVATIRNARGGAAPDPVRAAKLAIAAGADGITAHLREDRRHIRDDDIARLKAEIDKPLNFEMAATDEMLAIALKTKAACGLPRSGKAQRTHHRRRARCRRSTDALWRQSCTRSNMPASACRCSSPRSRAQIEAAAALGSDVIEIHTGAWCEALAKGKAAMPTSRMASDRRRRGNWPPASAWKSMPAMASITPAPKRSPSLPQIVELNIGHFLIGEAVFEGLAATDQIHARGHGPRPREGQRMIPKSVARGFRIRSCARRKHDHRPRLRSLRCAPHRQRPSSATATVFSTASLPPAERAKAERRANKAETYAKRFAAKEACSKALGTGLRAGVFWRDMGVVNLPGGRPTMKLTGGALARLKSILPPGHEARIDVSLTDEGPTAQAIVIISAVPAGSPGRSRLRQ